VGSLWSCLATGEAEEPRVMAWSRKSCRCSGSAQQRRRDPRDLAKTESRVRLGRACGFQRTWSGERTRRWQPLPRFPNGAQARSSSPRRGRARASAAVRGGVAGELEMRLRGKVGTRGAWGYLFGEVALMTGRGGHGALGGQWPGWAVASTCGF
jgi:hypothetical protein